ncbi:MAG: hypothetical protein D6737_09905 [Chloroflexi bacterium]|nr:MAG: hypothetical protein CUN54_02135 [Phototrophicales bacterium]RMF79871.1 MAG: hypothetical protein D6737_09905 [Chloroflexota bacterium]
MIQRFTAQLPSWARTDHPFLRYELLRSRGDQDKRKQYTRALVTLLLLGFLFGAGYLLATDFLTDSPGQNLTDSVMSIVYWPLVVVQVILQIGALALTSNTVSEEKRRQTWDNLRATQSGAELTLRTRWASVFYRMRGLIAIVLVLRIVLILGILLDLTAFQGRFLDLQLTGPEPSVPLVVGALLLSFLMTAALLLPFSSMGFDAAIGLLVSTFVEQRTFSILLQLLLIALRIALVAGLLFTAMQFVDGDLDLSNTAAWVLVGASAAVGDWGLAFLNFTFYGEIWATIPYGVFYGLALLIFAIVQAALTDAVLNLAVRRAENKG